MNEFDVASTLKNLRLHASRVALHMHARCSINECILNSSKNSHREPLTLKWTYGLEIIFGFLNNLSLILKLISKPRLSKSSLYQSSNLWKFVLAINVEP